MGSCGLLKIACIVFLFCAVTVIPSHAQTFKTLVSFDKTNGAMPDGPLIQGKDGNLYGMTLEGGPADAGTIFKITQKGKLTTLYSFCAQHGCPDGYEPYGGLVQATDGDFYGTTAGLGGPRGTVLKITATGTLTTLVRGLVFPNGALVQANDGNFYGTTESGGR